MGQKVNPIGLRLGINRTWDSRWFAEKDFANLLMEDFNIRKFVKKELKQAAVARVVIERPAKKCRVSIYTARPGIIIGKKGADIEKLRKKLSALTNADEVMLNIVEVRKPELDAQLAADNVAQQLERRVSFRRAVKRIMQSAQRMGVLGVRVNCSGRLGGAEIARAEWYREGRVPLHTLRADIDYAESEALTTYGIIGVKVFFYKGDILEKDPMARDNRLKDSKPTAK